MKKPDKSVELVQALLASKKFRAWKPQTIHHKRSNGKVKTLEYKGKNHDLFPSYSYQNNNANPKRPFEKHYTPAEVAQIWGINVDMARDLFRGEEDVLKLERTGNKKYVANSGISVAPRSYQDVQGIKMFSIYRRRNPEKCRFTSRTENKCKCPISVDGTLPTGKRLRKTLKVRDWTRHNR